MTAIEVRPLGWREHLVGFELWRAGGVPLLTTEDVRHAFVLWDSRGRPHQPAPVLNFDRPVSGRELMQAQEVLWRSHASTVRRLFGQAPLMGQLRYEAPGHGVLAFPLGHNQGVALARWTLVLQGGPLWHFTTAQIVGGTAGRFPPSGQAAVAERGKR